MPQLMGEVAPDDARARALDAEALGYTNGHEPAKTRQAALKSRSKASGNQRVKNADR